MKKLFKKFLCFSLVTTLVLGSSLTAFANEEEYISDPYTIEGQYVQELVDFSAEKITALPLSEAKTLFEKAFIVSADNYSEDEIRLGLDGLAFGLKFQTDMEEIKAIIETEPAYKPVDSRSFAGDKYYAGNIGVAWTRDIRNGYSPLTLGEILSGTYTLEVDYITWNTAATILTASLNQSSFNQLVNYVGSSATGTVIGSYIVKALGLKGKIAVVSSVIVGAAVAKGWDWYRSIDRDNMNNCFQRMDQNNQLMKVQFKWSGNMVNKIYTTIPKSTTMSNPFPGTYADWHVDQYGYMYNY